MTNADAILNTAATYNRLAEFIKDWIFDYQMEIIFEATDAQYNAFTDHYYYLADLALCKATDLMYLAGTIAE